MKILLLCDDFFHPGEVASKGLAPVARFEMDVISDAGDFDAAALAGYDVVVLSKDDHVSRENKSNWKTGAVQAAFVEYVENGGGLLAVHSGIVANEDENGKITGKTAVLENLIGCRFKFHPDNCPVTHGVLKPHPVTAGVGTFCEVDEHYQIEILSDDVDILAASYSAAQGDPKKYETEPYFNSPACIAPCVCVRTQGKGRVCVLTPGHLPEVWLNPEFSRMLGNALRWCAG